MLTELGTGLPTGLGTHLKNYSLENPYKMRASFSRVETEVLMVNPALNLPLNLEAGKPCNLGFFADSESEITLECWPNHGRSAIVGRVVFSDNHGNLFRDLDLKGIGHIKYPHFLLTDPSKMFPVLNPNHGIVRSDDGLLTLKAAVSDYQRSEGLTPHGISTHRVVGIIRLDEIIYKREKVPIYDAALRGLIPGGLEPVISIRAFKLKTRIRDLGPWLPDQARLLFEDAKTVVADTTGNLKLLQTGEYLKWFAENLGTNVGKLHKLKFAHNFLTSHNIALDCSLVDLDCMSSLDPFSQQKDLAYIKKSIHNLLKLISFQERYANLPGEEDLTEIFRESYRLINPEPSSH